MDSSAARDPPAVCVAFKNFEEITVEMSFVEPFFICWLSTTWMFYNSYIAASQLVEAAITVEGFRKTSKTGTGSTANTDMNIRAQERGSTPSASIEYKSWRTQLKTKQHNMTDQQETSILVLTFDLEHEQHSPPLLRVTQTIAQLRSLCTRHTRTTSKTKESRLQENCWRSLQLFLQLLLQTFTRASLSLLWTSFSFRVGCAAAQHSSVGQDQLLTAPHHAQLIPALVASIYNDLASSC